MRDMVRPYRNISGAIIALAAVLTLPASSVIAQTSTSTSTSTSPTTTSTSSTSTTTPSTSTASTSLSTSATPVTAATTTSSATGTQTTQTVTSIGQASATAEAAATAAAAQAASAVQSVTSAAALAQMSAQTAAESAAGAQQALQQSNSTTSATTPAIAGTPLGDAIIGAAASAQNAATSAQDAQAGTAQALQTVQSAQTLESQAIQTATTSETAASAAATAASTALTQAGLELSTATTAAQVQAAAAAQAAAQAASDQAQQQMAQAQAQLTAEQLTLSSLTALSGTTQALQSSMQMLNNTANQAVAGINGALSGATGSINGALSDATGSINGALSGATGSINGALSDATGSINGALSGATGSINGALSGATGSINGALSGATGSINGALSGATGDLNGALGNANQGLSGAASQAGAASSNAANQATQTGNQAAADANGQAGAAAQSSNDATMASAAAAGLADDACPTPNCGSAKTTNMDTRYSDLKLKGAMQTIDNSQPTDNDPNAQLDPGIQGVMSSQAISHKSTVPMSLVQNYPWMYKEVDQPETQQKLQRGMANSTSIDLSSAVSTSLSTTTSALDNIKCKPITNTCGSPDYPHYERWVRLQYDSCANQYILPMGLTPSYIFSKSLRSHGVPMNESMCQPLRLTPLDCTRDITGACKKDAGSRDGQMYDYRAWGYLELAWKNVLDSNYSPNGGAATGNDKGTPPTTSDNAKINSPGISGEKGFGDPLNASLPGGSGTPDSGSYTGKLTTINDLAQYPYERIWDPTHPYSPRWDFSHVDRDFSDDARLNGTPQHGYDPSPSKCIVRCAAVPVDILTFRATEFGACMGCRIAVNTTCFWSEVTYLMTPLPDIGCPSDPNAVVDTVSNNIGCHGPATPLTTCKTFYDQAGKWPVCSTKFDHPNDNVPLMCLPCVILSGDKNPTGGVKKCCNDLAQALAPINTLKIRNAGETKSVLPLPEGYAFKQYFGNHMPYMRWWDTGTAAGGSKDASTNYNPSCDMGQYDVIIGVGVEGQSCKYGGGAGLSYPDDGSCITLKNPDALTSWEELKQYQMNSMRNYGLNCLVQYEKVYKKYGAEDGVLTAAGGYFISQWPEPKDPTQTKVVGGSEQKSNPWPLLWRGYLSDPDPTKRFPCFGSTSSCGSGGYSGPGAISGGLDNAQTGDIIYLTPDDVAPKVAAPAGQSNAPTGSNSAVMPFIAIVTGVGHDSCNDPTKPNKYIDVADVNNGKYPDVCGNTDYMGQGLSQTRKIYKDSLPSYVNNALYPTGTVNGTCGIANQQGHDSSKLNDSGNCNDPRLSTCTYGSTMWGNIHVYRPTQDVRNGQ